jgi:tetratricopeptide (TPR) repeat protein
MLDKDMSKGEIETELKGKGDFVQIDYLTKFIDKKPPIHIKKFALMKLIEIYENKKMFSDVARMYEQLAINALSFSERGECFVKEAEYYIRAGYFERADSAMRRAMELSTHVKKAEIYSQIKNFYKKQAEICEKESKRNNAVKAYEKLLVMRISDSEREEIKQKLLSLYESLGKFGKKIV